MVIQSIMESVAKANGENIRKSEFGDATHIPDYAIATFKKLFPDHDCKGLKIEQASIINYTMYYIAKTFNKKVFKLFDYNEILCYPFVKEMKIGLNIEEPKLEDIQPETEQAVEAVYQRLKDYIFNYVGLHESSIIKNVSSAKINSEIISAQYLNLREKIKQHYMNLPKYDYEEEVLSIRLVMICMGVPTLYNDEDTDIYINAAQLLAAVAEKLYYFILAEVKRVVENDIVELDVQPDIPSIEPALMESYNSLDTYNKAVVSLFIQNMTKHSVSQ